ncbi:MAG: DUF4349 domain-containing protein [Chitinophagaceae bacterium]
MKLAFSLLILLASFLSCGKSGQDNSIAKDNSQTSLETDYANDENAKPVASNTDSSSGSPLVLQGTSPLPGADWDKKIIKTATLKLEIKDIKSYSSLLHSQIKQAGGYIAKEEQRHSDYSLAVDMEIKVPVGSFEPLLVALTGNDAKIIERTINTQDVTGEVVDTKSRLVAKEQMRLRYLDFLKNAKTMTEVLQVQSEINRLQEDIEAASGHVNYLSHQSALSTIHLYFSQAITSTNKTDPLEPSFSDRVIAALKNGGNFIAELFIALLTVWPIWIIAITLIIIWKKNRNQRIGMQAKL